MSKTEWKECTLGDLIRIKHGYAFKGDYITTNDNGVVLVTPGNFAIGGGFQERKCKFFSSDYPNDYVLKAGDLIVTMTDLSKDGDTLGYSAKVPSSENRVYLHNQRIGLIELKNKNVDPNFLYWVMRSPSYQKGIVATASGSTVKHTSPGRICESKILLPPLAEQQRIAKILSSLDDKIELNNAINRNLEEQAKAIFNSIYDKVVDQIPFTSIISIASGGTPRTSESSFWNGNIPFFTPKDVGFPFALNTEKYITNEGLNNCNSRLYPTNTTFITARGTVGKLSLAALPMAMNQSCFALVSERMNPILIYMYAIRAVDSLKKKSNGAVFDAITIKDFETEHINKLSDETIKTLSSTIEPIYNQIRLNTIENHRLSDLRDSLLPKLMSGDLGV